MSWTDLKHVHAMNYRWRDPLHFCVMAEIAKRYNPTYGYAWPALETIGERYGRSARRVNEVTVELENLGLLIRLGPDPDVLGSRQGTQRFVPTWRVENGVQQQLREALEADDAATRGAAAVDNSVEKSVDAAVTGAAHRMGACDPSHGGHAGHRMPGMRPIACDQGTDLGTCTVPRSTSTAAAAAQLRLPAVLAQIRRTLAEEVLRRKSAFLATAPADDRNWKQLLAAACDVLRDPQRGSRLMKDYDPANPSDVAEAVRLTCDKRHIDWGKPSYTRIDEAVAAADVLLKLRSGDLRARPRDLARKQR